MAYEFKLPDLGEGLTEGEVARWLVAEGQEVAEDDPLVEIQTDKTTVEIPSPAAGTVARIMVAEGQVVPVGTVLVVIGDGRGQPSGTDAAGSVPAGSAGASTSGVNSASSAMRRNPRRSVPPNHGRALCCSAQLPQGNAPVNDFCAVQHNRNMDPNCGTDQRVLT